jgi:lysophospholipase L1-like esterase
LRLSGIFPHTAGVRQRRTARLAGIAAGAAVAVSCFLVITGCALGSSPVAGPPHRSAPAGAAHPARVTRALADRGGFAACEQRLENGPRSIPTVAIVGASYTAGVGPGNPALSWAAVLVRRLRWNAVIYGVSGVGYIRPGDDDLGPVRRLLADERLHGLAPSLVIVQAGHDDGGEPAGAEERQVRRTIELIRAQSPHARIALLTVFTGPGHPVSASLVRIDKAIVSAARAADPKVIIMDPLTGHWKYAREHGGLHPTAAGDAWIAGKVASILRAHGIDSRPRTAVAPVVCDRSIRSATASA